jgi:AcrR family transcriptional regulator
MTMLEPKESALAAAAEMSDGGKRAQILDGARAVFLARGFDAASMGEIARQAGVSKGTLYVYFASKEELFSAIVHDQCMIQAEQVFALDDQDHDVAAVLTRLGTSFAAALCRVERLSSLRTIVAISERMPAAGQRFYETGPATGIARLAHYLDAQVAAGMLAVEDTEVAAAQFLEACVATMMKPMLFGVMTEPPTEARIALVVGMAVRAFMAVYAKQ